MARESSDFISQFNTTQFAHTALALGYKGVAMRVTIRVRLRSELGYAQGEGNIGLGYHQG